MDIVENKAEAGAKRRLAWPARHRQLLEVALSIVRDEGADSLTLGILAEKAQVSKPVVYDHFETRSALLTDLYRWIDSERKYAFQAGIADGHVTAESAIDALSSTYIKCATDASGEFLAVGAAMAGNEERSTIYQELVDNGVQMFEEILRPHTHVVDSELERTCVALVGAGEALSASVIRGSSTQADAIKTFSSLIRQTVSTPAR